MPPGPGPLLQRRGSAPGLLRTHSRDGVGGMEAQTGVVNALLLLGEAQAAAAAAAAAGTPGGNAGNELDLAESAYSDALLHLTQSFGMGLTSGGGGGGGGSGGGGSGAGGGGGGGGFADFNVDLSMSAPGNLGGDLITSGRGGGGAGTEGGTGASCGAGGGRGYTSGGGAHSSVAELRLRATLGLARVALQRGEPQRCLQLLCDAPGHEPRLDPRVCQLNGEAHAAAGELEAAQEELGRAVRLWQRAGQGVQAQASRATLEAVRLTLTLPLTLTLALPLPLTRRAAPLSRPCVSA